MHSKPMSETEGKFSTPEPDKYYCQKCGQVTATCRKWESSCGGYGDWKYECQNPTCGHSWWVEGPDS